MFALVGRRDAGERSEAISAFDAVRPERLSTRVANVVGVALFEKVGLRGSTLALEVGVQLGDRLSAPTDGRPLAVGSGFFWNVTDVK